MKLVLTILVRDEADIVDANLAYHLDRGVDFVVATDNNSCDGTLDILEEYRRMGYLHLIQEAGEDYAQSAWVTRMAHIASEDFGADWIVHGDADEFWWPRHGTLKDTFASIPERYGVFHAHRFDFVPRPDENGFFAERMTVRTELPSKTQVAHRPDPSVVVGQGAHRLDTTSLGVAPPWYAVDVLHFPLRSYDQFEQKIANAGPATGVKHWRNAYELHSRGELRAAWDALLLDDAAIDDLIARGEAGPDLLWVGRSTKRSYGRFVRDDRLRDHLRALRAGQGDEHVSPTGFRVEPDTASPVRPIPTAAVELEATGWEIDERVKTWVLKNKQLARELKERGRESAALRSANAALQKQLDRESRADGERRRRRWPRLSARPRSEN